MGRLPLRAVIFDMDGILIDTEPIWRQVEAEIFRDLGLDLSEEQLLQTMGVRVAEVVELWYRRRPWEGPMPAEVTAQIVAGVIDHVRHEGEPIAGVCEALALVHRAGLPIAIASSSSLEMIRVVVERLNIGGYVQVTCSADAEPMGKPHPAVYLRTARLLGVPAEQCLAIEDSPNGVVAAKEAGMFCIAVPDPHVAGDPRLERADLHLSSLGQFTPELLAELTEARV